ncbi:MAG: efflux RND transporter periplasmic adaptor subunit [Planctomycetaceae bacterium]|nr:efflux RND transporter periplasmic adaptor subunit [Planctomycetaceae bacterium]
MPASDAPVERASGSNSLREQVQSLRLPTTATAPPQRSVVPWLIVCLLLATNAVTAWQLLQQRNTPALPADTPATAAKSSAVTAAIGSTRSTAPAETSADAISLESKGYIQPAHQILVSPKVSGMVLELRIEEGMRVDKGYVLAIIEDTQYRADHDRSVATLNLQKQKLLELERGARTEELEQSQAELAEAKETLTELERDYQRIKGLREQNASSEQALTQAESLYLAQLQRVARLTSALQLLQVGPRVERIDAARAEVQQAEAEVTRTTWQLDNCTIRAPIGGTILIKNAEEGNIVNPIAFNGSFSLCEMADLADLEVELDIQERDISKVFKGQRCKVRAEAFPDRVYEATVSRLMPIADRAKGAVPVRVKLTVPAEEEGVFLKPEMGALVTFYAAEQAEAAAAAK